MTDSEHTQTASWLVPAGEQQGLGRYVQTIGERWKLIAITVLVTTLFAALLVAVSTKTYEATSDLLISPVSPDNAAFSNLGLIRDSSDPTRGVQTAAQLVTTFDVAARAKKTLGTTRSPRSLLKSVQAKPVASSSIVAITAKGHSGEEAQRLANAFGQAVVADRTAKLKVQLDQSIAGLRGQLKKPSPGDPSVPGLRAELSTLETLRTGEDPTIRFDTPAQKPDSPSWPKTKLTLIAGILAGLVLGIGAAFAAKTLDPRLRREEQLRSMYRLPVLARIPYQRPPSGRNAIAPRQLQPAGVEAFRILRATLSGASERRSGGQTVMITGASPAEGKTTTAVNLGASFALAGAEVILIEADLRRPRMGDVFRVNPARGIASVLIDQCPLSEALIEAPGYTNLKLLLVDRSGEWMADQFSLPAARTLVSDAKAMADVVIIDSPPLTEVVDALPLVQTADDVVIVARLGETRLHKLTRLGELLAQQGIKPLGFSVVGVSARSDHGYYGAPRDVESVETLGHPRQRVSVTTPE